MDAVAELSQAIAAVNAGLHASPAAADERRHDRHSHLEACVIRAQAALNDEINEQPVAVELTRLLEAARNALSLVGQSPPPYRSTIPPSPGVLLITNEPASSLSPNLDALFLPPSLSAAVAPPAFVAADGRPPSMSMCFVGDPLYMSEQGHAQLTPLLLLDAPFPSLVASQSFAPTAPADSATYGNPWESNIVNESAQGVVSAVPVLEPAVALPLQATFDPLSAIPVMLPVTRSTSDGSDVLSMAKLRSEPTIILVDVIRTGAGVLLSRSGATMSEVLRVLAQTCRLTRTTSSEQATVLVDTATNPMIDAHAPLFLEPTAPAVTEISSLLPESAVHATAQLRCAIILGQRATSQAANDEALKLGAVQALAALAKETSQARHGPDRRMWFDVHVATCKAVVRLLQVRALVRGVQSAVFIYVTEWVQ